MSGKRASAMGQIANYTTTVKAAATPDDAVAAFLGQPVPSTAPGTQPTVTKTTTTAEVAGEESTATDINYDFSIVGQGANAFADFVRTFYRRGRTRLERVPIPGGIAIPLGILIILFLVVLPINGHTRLMWLWLALTNQAQVGGPPIAPTALTAPAAASYGTTSSTSNSTTSSSASSVTNTTAKVTASSSKNNITVTTNNSKTHTKKGGGPGPDNPQFVDPTAPTAQLSYSYLLRTYNGYE